MVLSGKLDNLEKKIHNYVYTFSTNDASSMKSFLHRKHLIQLQ